MPVRTTPVQFPGALGHELAAQLDHRADAPAAYAVFAHCFTCSKDYKAVRRISRTLAERGIAVLRIDFTGLGQSGGDFEETTFSSNVGDLVAAAEFLRREHRPPQLLIGHSLGGAAALAAAHRIPEIQAVSTIAAPSGTSHLRRLLIQKAPEIERTGEADVEIAGRRFRIKQQLLDDLDDQPLREMIRTLNRPLLIFHSPDDRTVDIDEARKIFETARHPKSFISLDGADHLLLARTEDATFVGRMLAEWTRRYLAEASEQPSDPEVPHGEVLVETGPSGFATDIWAGPHRLRADEPQDLGGTETGSTPDELLLAALGSCTAMTLRMYADRKTWPLRRTRIRLRHSRVNAADYPDEFETDSGQADLIERRIELLGDLDEEQRRRLLEIADRCPVSRTLTTATRIRSTLA